jgi:asparagine synthase (glutamine-hydrolysing)
MCGIAGIVGGVGDYSANVATMLHAQAHRGPDGSGMVRFEGGAAGAVRLALVDLSDRGQQPIWSVDQRVAILFNGEMYNHVEQRSRLVARGYHFRSSTDTEVILALYLKYGMEFVDHVRGMFALSILDWRDSTPGGQPTLVLARDHFGIKPLYMTRASAPGNPLVFASEIRSLLASGLIPKEIDRSGLIDYLALGFVVQPRTIIADVEMLERGSILRMTPSGSMERRRFWTIPGFQPARETFEQSAERLRAVLDETIALHAMADAPVGAFLSGGVDSSGVVGLMAKKNPKLRTYSLRLTDFPQADESEQASDFARSLGCQSTVVEVSGNEMIHLLPRFVAESDQPSVDGLNTWLVSRAAAKDVKGVLSGLGGDEWFAGYAATRNMVRYASGVGRIYPLAGKLAAAVRRWAPKTYFGRKLEGLSLKAKPWTTWLDCRSIFGFELAAELVNDRAAHQNGREDLERILSDISPQWSRESPVGLACLLDVDVYMRCQLLRDSDTTSMASSLELRVPFVDLKVAEFSRSCADSFKLHSGGGNGNEYGSSGAKQVLIRALRDVLPADIARRPKRGFSIPYKHWLQNSLAELASEACSHRTIADRGLLDPDLASALVLDNSARRWSAWPVAWPLMLLELWCKVVLDEPETKIRPQELYQCIRIPR